MVERICLGVIVGPHGVRGGLRVKSFTAVPEDIATYGPVSTEDGARSWAVSVLGTAKGVVLCRLDGVADRNAAEALKGVRLTVPRDALPPPEDDEAYYHADLIGLTAALEDGTPLGTVRAVHDFGAGDMLEVALGASLGKEGRSVMVPFTRVAVPVVDLNGGRLVVAELPGLLDPEAEAEADESGHAADG